MPLPYCLYNEYYSYLLVSESIVQLLDFELLGVYEIAETVVVKWQMTYPGLDSATSL